MKLQKQALENKYFMTIPVIAIWFHLNTGIMCIYMILFHSRQFQSDRHKIIFLSINSYRYVT